MPASRTPLRPFPFRRRAARLAWLAVAVIGCASGDPSLRRPCHVDPVFGLPTPLLFAHRGGAREAPESTRRAFTYALEKAHTDVLELDVQLTRDEQFVVWHGPSLDNVRIEGQPDAVVSRCRRDIGEYDWSELAGHAWVADPPCTDPSCDLSAVPQCADRQLLLLQDFLELFPCVPVNIEAKNLFISPAQIDRLVAIFNEAPNCPETNAKRPMLFASGNDLALIAFRDATSSYATNVGGLRSLIAPAPFLCPQEKRALQVPRADWYSGPWVVSNMHNAGGAVHVFVTHFLGTRGLDEYDGQITQAQIDELLDRHVDGIMTDRPLEVRALIDNWKQRQTSCAPLDAGATAGE